MDNHKIIPFGNQILIEPVETNSALGQKSLCEYDKVIAIGDLVEKVKVGDTLAFLVWGLNSLELNEKKYYFVAESDEFVLCKIEM